jgi:hypothetical protein
MKLGAGRRRDTQCAKLCAVAARAAIGHATAAPLSAVYEFSPIDVHWPCDPFRGVMCRQWRDDTISRRESLDLPTSQMGQKRRFDDVRTESAFLPFATFERTSRDVSNVPMHEIASR